MLLISYFLFHFSMSSALKKVQHAEYKNIVVEWTGYKYTEKAAVKGQLKTIKASIKGRPRTLEQLLLATSFEVDSLSVDSGDAARDSNLREHFFKLMKSPKITGKILSYKDNVAQVELMLNGVSQQVPFTVTKEGAMISATGEIDILNFSMQPSLKKINEICFELHKGKDGVSKTWNQVNLLIKAETLFHEATPQALPKK